MNATLLDPPRHLWVRLPGPLGDAVMSTVALRALRAALPATRITWAGGAAVCDALDGLAARDDVMPVAGAMAKGVAAPFRLGRELKRLGADAALLLPNSFSSALAARLGGMKVRVGTQRDGRRALLTHAVHVPEEKGNLVPRPMVDHYLDLVRPFGAVGDGRAPALVARPFDRERARARLSQLGLGQARLLGVNPGAAFGPSKCYPPGLLGQAVRAIQAELGLTPLVLAGPGEEQQAREVAQAIGPTCCSTADLPPSVGELKGLLLGLDLLLTTDAGPRHIAEALGIPTVVWMGPTDPRFSGHSGAQIVRVEELPCLGCHLPRCPIEHPCMRNLPPERLVQATRAALAARPVAPVAG